MKYSFKQTLNFFSSIKRYCVLSFFVICSCSCNVAFAKNSCPVALIGGQGNAPYAAFLKRDGSITTLPGLPPTGLIYRVALNPSRKGLIGGTNGLDAYAALVTPRGKLTALNGLIAPGEIYSVALNKSGRGIIGGGHFNSNVPYAALVSPKGKVKSLDVPANGLIYSVAIDNAHRGIIGGKGPSNSAYAALVSPRGILKPLKDLPTIGGIFWVASIKDRTA